MAIAFRAAASAAAVSTALTLSKPSGVVSGDVMFAVIGTGGLTITPPPGGGWTQLASTATNSPSTLFWKVAGSSEPTSYKFDASGTGDLSGIIAAFSGAVTTTPASDHYASGHNFGTPLTVPALSWTGAQSGIAMAFVVTDTGGTGVTPPSGYTEPTNGDVASSGGLRTEFSYASPASSATSVSSTTTSGGGNWSAFAIFLPDPVVSAAATLGATAGLSVAGVAERIGAVSMAATAGLTATAVRSVVPTATLAAAAALSATGSPITTSATTSLTATAALTAAATRTQFATAATLAATAGLTAAAIPTRFATVTTLAATAGMTASAVLSRVGTASLAATAGLTVAAAVTVIATTTLTATAALTATGLNSTTAGTSMAALAAMSVAMTLVRPAAAALAATAGLSLSVIASRQAVLPPDGIAAASNITGAYTLVTDDPDAPDGSWMIGAGPGTAVAVRLTFQDPPGNLMPGAGKQRFRVLARRS